MTSNRVIVKFFDRVSVPYEDGIEGRLEVLGLGPGAALLVQFPGITVDRLATSLEPDEMVRIVNQVVKAHPEARPPNFLTYFAVSCPANVDPQRVAAALASWNSVEDAHVEQVAVPASYVQWWDDPMHSSLSFLDAAPVGIGVKPAAWLFGAGEGQRLIDIEYGCNLKHDDFPKPPSDVSLVWGLNSTFFSHGTSAIGICVAADNTIGVVGIAPKAKAFIISPINALTTKYDLVGALWAALALLAPGDVLLVEQQVEAEPEPGIKATFAPVEAIKEIYPLLKLCADKGAIVVEPAGNGSLNLDKAFGGLLSPSSSSFQGDSGAIMVGAGSASVPHTRLSASNFGDRVNCFAWGEKVLACGSDATGTASKYAFDAEFFVNTSAASAIIAGAALLYQSIAVRATGARLNGKALRDLFSDFALNTHSATPGTSTGDRIGVMPDVSNLVKTKLLGSLSSLYVRDGVGDTGDAFAGPLAASPDIIVRNLSVVDPDLSFGESSGTKDKLGISENPTAGSENSVYVRALNKGGKDGSNIIATVFAAPVAPLLLPSLMTLVGTTVIPKIPAGNTLAVSNPITWIPSAPGHYCFVATIGSLDAPAPALSELLGLTYETFRTFVRNYAQVTWRNVNVVKKGGPSISGKPVPPGFDDVEFLVLGEPEAERLATIEVIGELPLEAELLCEVPIRFAEELNLGGNATWDADSGFATLRLVPYASTVLGRTGLSANASHRLRLMVKMPANAGSPANEEAFRVAVRQLHDNVEVGRVTWLVFNAG